VVIVGDGLRVVWRVRPPRGVTILELAKSERPEDSPPRNSGRLPQTNSSEAFAPSESHGLVASLSQRGRASPPVGATLVLDWQRIADPRPPALAEAGLH
jgi:hypothetical protein